MSGLTDTARTYLAVPFEQKDAAKALGAKWDRDTKAWFAPAGTDTAKFQKWMPPSGSALPVPGSDPMAEFAAALKQAGLQLSGDPQMDGRLHRVPAEGDHGYERSGAYVGYLDGRPAGFLENFRTGHRARWKASGAVKDFTPEERARMLARAAQRRHGAALAREQAYGRAAERAIELWCGAEPLTRHEYLAAKGVRAHGLRVGAPGQTIVIRYQDGQGREIDVAGRLIVPVNNAAGRLASLQFIARDGGHYLIGNAQLPGPLFVVEGYATAATVHELTGQPAIAAFNASNLAAVARACGRRFSNRTILIAGDNDHQREAAGKLNVGREKAAEAARAAGAVLMLPRFAEREVGTDWNDFARLHGNEAARNAILVVVAAADGERIERGSAEAREVCRKYRLFREP